MESLMKLNRLSLALLCATHQRAQQQRQDGACILAAAKGMGLQEWEFRRAFQYLLGEGLVERVAGEIHRVKLTSWGLSEARHRSNTEKSAKSAPLFYLGDQVAGQSRLPEVG